MTADTQEVFTALADPIRRAIIDELATGVSRTATEFSEAFDITRQGVAKHLDRLAEAGLVHSERQGRETRYTLTPAPLTGAAGWIAAVEARWDRRLADLKDYAEGTYQQESAGGGNDDSNHD